MNVVAQHRIMPDQGIEMTISLDGGTAEIDLHGSTRMPCWCGESHQYRVDAKLQGGTSMDKIDMDDLEGAIRGEDLPAQKFGWRLMHKLMFNETAPCEVVL